MSHTKPQKKRAAYGIIENAPINQSGDGYAFVQLESADEATGVTSVYVPADLVKKTGITHANVGERVRVTYSILARKKLTAIRVHLLPDTVVSTAHTEDDQGVAETIMAAVDNHEAALDQLYDALEMLAERGCDIPEDYRAVPGGQHE